MFLPNPVLVYVETFGLDFTTYVAEQNPEVAEALYWLQLEADDTRATRAYVSHSPIGSTGRLVHENFDLIRGEAFTGLVSVYDGASPLSFATLRLTDGRIAETVTGDACHACIGISYAHRSTCPKSTAHVDYPGTGEAGFASLAVVSTLSALVVLLLVVLPLLSQTIAGVRAATGGSL